MNPGNRNISDSNYESEEREEPVNVTLTLWHTMEGIPYSIVIFSDNFEMP